MTQVQKLNTQKSHFKLKYVLLNVLKNTKVQVLVISDAGKKYFKHCWTAVDKMKVQV